MLYFGFSPYATKFLEKLACIHEEDYTNTIRSNEVRLFFVSLLQTIYKDWEEIEESEHCDQIKDEDEIKKISDYLKLGKNQFNDLKNQPIYKIPIGGEEKFRAIVIFRNNHLDLLLFDPNHNLFPDPGKFEHPSENEAICLMKKENCKLIFSYKPLSETELRRRKSIEGTKRKRK